MQVALTTAFWGSFRSGELFPDHFFPALHVTLSDVTINSSNVIIHLKTSKMDVAKKGIDVRLFQNESIVCAVQAVKSFVQVRNDNRSCSPFFILPNGQSLTRRAFIANLRHLLTLLGVQTSSFSGHSLRVGAATSAAAAGLPDHLIQTLGRWNSLSYLRYIRIDDCIIERAHSKISKFFV